MRPIEVLTLYQTLAAGGFRAPPRSIREVVNSKGGSLKRYGLEVQQVFDPTPLYLLNYAMQATMREGTGASAYQRLPVDLMMAGKTGTTNDLRDAWFAGYTGNYLAVVWLGHDDNRTRTGLSGGTGALPVWTDLMARLHPVSLTPVQPENVQWQWVDRASGPACLRSTVQEAVYMPFVWIPCRRKWSPVPRVECPPCWTG
jgi:penicillin-binding protein 1B